MPETLRVQGVIARTTRAGIVYVARYCTTGCRDAVKSVTLDADNKQDALVEAKDRLDKMIILGQTVKRCSACHKYKPVGMFYKNASRVDGLNHECKECFDLRSKGLLPKRKGHRQKIVKCMVCGELYERKRSETAICDVCKRYIKQTDFEVNRWFNANGVKEPTPEMHRQKVLQIVLRSAIKGLKKKGA